HLHTECCLPQKHQTLSRRLRSMSGTLHRPRLWYRQVNPLTTRSISFLWLPLTYPSPWFLEDSHSDVLDQAIAAYRQSGILLRFLRRERTPTETRAAAHFCLIHSLR